MSEQSPVAELLRRVKSVPKTLRERVVGSSDGNPFCLEELVGMLIEDGAIRIGPERWQVDAGRLDQVRLPSTLTALLQALRPARRHPDLRCQ